MLLLFNFGSFLVVLGLALSLIHVLLLRHHLSVVHGRIALVHAHVRLLVMLVITLIGVSLVSLVVHRIDGCRMRVMFVLFPAQLLVFLQTA